MLGSFPDPSAYATPLHDNALGVDAHFEGAVTCEEVAWMLQCRPLHPPPDLTKLSLDYSERQARLMLHSFERFGAKHLLGVLNWAGVGSRWEVFLRYISTHSKDISAVSTNDAFAGFVQYLGRVTSYRALALSNSELDKIFDMNFIFPSGQLKTTLHDLALVVSTHGACKVAVARLFIADLERLIGFDPSASLHDEWATASVIASGYQEKTKPVYLFEVSVPKVATLGWRLVDVMSFAPHFLGTRSSSVEPWFSFENPAFPRGIWFDATDQRTERYVLYGIPFLRQRLRRLWVFRTLSEIQTAAVTFASRQEHLRAIYPLGQGMYPPIGHQ